MVEHRCADAADLLLVLLVIDREPGGADPVELSL